VKLSEFRKFRPLVINAWQKLASSSGRAALLLLNQDSHFRESEVAISTH